MEPIDYLRTFRRRWGIIVACVLIGVVAGVATAPKAKHTQVRTAGYKATNTQIAAPQSQLATSFLARNGLAGSNSGPPLDLIALLVTTGDVPKDAAGIVHSKSDPTILASHINASADSKLGILRITASGTDPDDTAALANAFADATNTYLASQAAATAAQSINDMNARLKDLQGQISGLQAGISAGGPNVAVLSAQRDSLVRQYGVFYDRLQQLTSTGPPTSGFVTLERATSIPVATGGIQAPSGRKGRALTAGGLGLLLGLAVALLLEKIDSRLFTKEAVEEALALPVVTEVPAMDRAARRNREVMTVTRPTSSAAESYRMLRTAVVHSRGPRVTSMAAASPGRPWMDNAPTNGSPRVVLVTSAGRGEGKASTVANLASSFAEGGRSVVVVSADFREPRVEQYLHAEAPSEHSGETLTGIDAIARPTQIPNVRLCISPTEVTKPAGVLQAERVLIRQVVACADIVIVDASPLLVANDALELMPIADVVIVVSRIGRTTQEAAERVKELLTRVGAPVLGSVVIGANPPALRTAWFAPPVHRSKQGPLDIGSNGHANGNGNGSNGRNGNGVATGSGTIRGPVV